MNLFILTGLISFAGLYFWKTQFYRIIKIRLLAIPTLTAIFVLCLVIFSNSCVKAAGSGLNLWLNTVLPSLFPFFVASELLKDYGLVKAFGILLEPVMHPLFKIPGCGSFAFFMGTTSGYPVGAKITRSLRKEKLLSKTQAERLLAFSNNSGPLFIIGAVSVGMLNSHHIGVFLLICHIAASITVGIIFRFYKHERDICRYTNTAYNSLFSHNSLLSRLKKELFLDRNFKNKFGSILGKAVKNSIITSLNIGGFIILFSVIISLLLETGVISSATDLISGVLSPLGIQRDIITSILSGFFEITTGVKMASSIDSISLTHKLVAISIIIGWAGLSVHSQVINIISDTDISPKPYLTGKLLHGILGGIYTILGIKIANPYILKAMPAFYDTSLHEVSALHGNALITLKLITVILLVSASICTLLYKKHRLL